MSEETSLDEIDPPYLSVKETLNGVDAFSTIKKDLESHMAKLNDQLNTEQKDFDTEKAEKAPVPQFDVFLRTKYGQFSRGYPHSANKLGATFKRNVLSTTQSQVGYQKAGLKSEFKSLKVFTTVDWNNEGGEFKKDIEALHKETPGYFGKPRLDGNFPEVIKNKKNMMFVLRSIKQSQEKRNQKRNEHRDKIRAETKHQLFEKLF